MDDISYPNQNQANFAVPKDQVAKFRNQEQNLAQPKVAIIKSDIVQKTFQPPTPNLHDVREKLRTSTANIQKPQTPEPLKTKAQIDNKAIIGSLVRYVIIGVVALVFGYLLVNWPAISLKFNYWNTIELKHGNWSELHPVDFNKTKTTPQKLDENYLYIESLGIKAPVSWGVTDSDVSGMLSQGLVNYDSGALPDDAVGNIFISGQTSGPIWSSSQYKTVFTLLNKISTGDKILLVYKNKIYTYEVKNKYSKFGSVIIAPGSLQTSQLNLLAKYPVGIGWSTFDVQADVTNIEDNVAASIDDKTKNSGTELNPNTVTPTTTQTPTPTNTSPLYDSTAPQVFLPNL